MSPPPELPTGSTQRNSPTWVDDLAPALWVIALGDDSGTWHLTASGGASRYEQARKIAELSGRDPGLVHPTTHAALGRAAPRPAYSVLDCQAAREVFKVALPAWDEALGRYLSAVSSPEASSRGLQP